MPPCFAGHQDRQNNQFGVARPYPWDSRERENYTSAPSLLVLSKHWHAVYTFACVADNEPQ
jgi:hypothetical protein